MIFRLLSLDYSKKFLSGVTVDLNIQGKFSISHIQLLVSRRLMWCDEANTVIQKTLGDGMDFYMYGGMDEGLERGGFNRRSIAENPSDLSISNSIET